MDHYSDHSNCNTSCSSEDSDYTTAGLHNNRTGIGMKMSDIKLPMMIARTNGATTNAKTNISASALYKYLGWSGSRRTGANATAGVSKNGVPLLMYLDIFKNFFANTQENKFYMLKGGLSTLTIGPNIYKIPAKNIGIYPTYQSDKHPYQVLSCNHHQSNVLEFPNNYQRVSMV